MRARTSPPVLRIHPRLLKPLADNVEYFAACHCVGSSCAEQRRRISASRARKTHYRADNDYESWKLPIPSARRVGFMRLARCDRKSVAYQRHESPRGYRARDSLFLERPAEEARHNSRLAIQSGVNSDKRPAAIRPRVRTTRCTIPVNRASYPKRGRVGSFEMGDVQAIEKQTIEEVSIPA